MKEVDISSVLRNAGIKPSLQRVAIYKYLYTHRTHPSVDMVYRDLQPQMPTLSRTTVYNTISGFLDAGLVRPVTIEDTTLRYDIDTAEHGHFQCEKCGKVFDFSFDREAMELRLDKDFSVFDFQINVKGICNNCNNNIE
ncbi:MAG: Fur family transcriptional regulator [Fibrobacterota bacterium]